MIRTIFDWSCMVIATLVFGFLTLLTYPFDRRGKVIHHYASLWGKAALMANRVKVKIEGMAHLKKEGPYIFMSNHQGTYDIFVLLGHLPFQFKWLAKKELFSIPFFGWTMAAAGYISIDREGTRETVEAMNKAAQKIQDGMSVVISPKDPGVQTVRSRRLRKEDLPLRLSQKYPLSPLPLREAVRSCLRINGPLPPGKFRYELAIPSKPNIVLWKTGNP